MFSRQDILLLCESVGPEERLAFATYLERTEGEPDMLPRLYARVKLSTRELAILTALSTSSSVEGIAAALSISRNTVKTHLRNVYRKLGATNRDTALLRAAELGLLKTARSLGQPGQRPA